MLPAQAPASSSEAPSRPGGPLPRPAGIASLGSVEDLEKESSGDQGKQKLRAAKTVSLNQSKNKVRQAEDKLKEIDQLKEKLQVVPTSVCSWVARILYFA